MMTRTTIPQFLGQLAGAVDKLIQASGPERWKDHVLRWAAQTRNDKREGLPALDLPMGMSLDEKYALLAAVHDARARVEGGPQIDPSPDGCDTAYCVLKLRVVPFPAAEEAGLDESQSPRLLSILREVAADLEESSRLWTPDRTSGAHRSTYRDAVDEYERFLEGQGKPVEHRTDETPNKAAEPTTSVQDDGRWSKPDTPTRWAKTFKVSVRTLKRRFADGTIRHKELSDRSYMIHLDDLPSEE
jgi:hypothetical protein